MLSSARALGIPAPLALFITRTPAIFIPVANQVLRVTRVINILLRHVNRHVYVTLEFSFSHANLSAVAGLSAFYLCRGL